MQLNEIRKIKEDDRGVIYDCGASSFITRKKGTVSANHAHKDPEIVYLVRGEVELTIGEEVQIVKAPVMFKTKSSEYHKLIALTDIDLVIDREGEK
jgi:uncharacterized cupin superfamily protein